MPSFLSRHSASLIVQPLVAQFLSPLLSPRSLAPSTLSLFPRHAYTHRRTIASFSLIGGCAGSLQGFERTAVQLTARGIARRAVDCCAGGGAGSGAACTAEEIDRLRGLCSRLRVAADEKAGGAEEEPAAVSIPAL